MIKQGRYCDQALLRTTANTKAQTFAAKRLMRDLQEIQNEKVPTVGVTARPLKHDLFLWHANLRGPAGTPYQGGVFHLQLQIPRSYPHHPPAVRLLTPTPHPNIFGDYICLDMLRANRVEGQGWTSAYSIQSILVQLQSFLFEEDLDKDEGQQIADIKKAVKQANEFRCTERNCKHGGKLACWPTFSTAEQNPEQFLTLQTQNEIFSKQLICYHTKLPFSVVQLGLGLKVTKLSRSIQAEVMFDYISIKAFLKEGIRRSSSNERFTHWLPIYFGDNPDRFYAFATRALSMISTSHTGNFKPQQILEILPNIINTLVFYIADEKKHASLRMLRVLIHIHCCLLFLMQRHPELEEKIVQQIDNFVMKEECRVKSAQPNLGCLLALLAATSKRRFKDVASAYFAEQLDRQVLWILRDVPELVLAPKSQAARKNLDEVRAELFFKSRLSNFLLFGFYKLFITEVCQKFTTRRQLLQHYTQNHSRLSIESQFLHKTQTMLKQIRGFSSFFEFLQLPKLSNPELNQLLCQAIANSQRKKYHGCDLHQLPDSATQLKQVISAQLGSIYGVVTTQNGNEYEVEVEEKRRVGEEEWKGMCVQRWGWLAEEVRYRGGIKASQFAGHAGYSDAKPKNRVLENLNSRYQLKYVDYKQHQFPLPKLSWETLYIKLDLEQFLLHIDMNPDFKQLHEKLQLCNYVKLNNLALPLIQVANIKSGYYYVYATLSKLKTLKYLEIYGVGGIIEVEDKAAKAIGDGLAKFKGKLDIISYRNINFEKYSYYQLTHQFKNFAGLSSFRLESTNLFKHKTILKPFIKQVHNLIQLKLNDCGLNTEQAIMLADCVVRLKNLQIVQIKRNKNMGEGLPALVYHLAFNSKLVSLDISESRVEGANLKELVKGLTKLLMFSQSIELLKIQAIANLNPMLDQAFWTVLGENMKLRVLDVSNSGILDDKIEKIGFAVAYNAVKKGRLEYLNMKGCLNQPKSFKDLYNHLVINSYTSECNFSKWHSTSNKFYCSLKAIQLDNSVLTPDFELTEHCKLNEELRQDPGLVKLIARNSKLQTLSLCQTNLVGQSMAQILLLALDPTRKHYCSKLKVLNISGNSFGKEGGKILSQVMKLNNTLEVLDISKNRLGVSGARALTTSLSYHKTLICLNLFDNMIGYDGARAVAELLTLNDRIECLELGYNRIRDKGLNAIVGALSENPRSKLRILGLRFNFITSSSVENLIDNLPRQATQQNQGKLSAFWQRLKKAVVRSPTNQPRISCPLTELYIKNNLIAETECERLFAKHSELRLSVCVDIFDRLPFIETDRLERTVWLHPATGLNPRQIKMFFETNHKCGVVLDVRIRSGRKYPNRTKSPNLFALVEFAHKNSVAKALSLASRRLAIINSVSFRIFRAGEATFVYARKTAKQKKVDKAQARLKKLPFDKPEEKRGKAPRRVRRVRK